MSSEPKKDPNADALSRLPRKKVDPDSAPSRQPEVTAHVVGPTVIPVHEPEIHEPEIIEAESATQPQSQTEPAPKEKARFNFGPPFWTIASLLSLSVNLILFVALVVVWMKIPSINMGGVTNIGVSLLGGLYTNFEKMDRAHITRIVPVEATIPVKFDLAINQQTTVVLSQDVTIENARVTVSTGGLNITRALTTIVLPQGTNLPIVLNFTVPVETTVPVNLNVNVDIPLSETQLHEPFLGLRNVVQPFYCLINPSALNLDGQKICN